MTDEAYRGLQILRQYTDVDRRISELYDEVSRLKALSTRATSRWSATRSSGTGNHSNVETAMISVIDLEAQLDSEIDRLNAMRYRIQSAINKMDDERLKRILEMRYIRRKSWEAITIAMGLQDRQSYYLHAVALEKFYVNYEDCSKVQ